MKRRKRGFTLIELIIVVVIIGILAVVSVTRYSENIKKSRYNVAVDNLSSIRKVALAYYAVYGFYPTVDSGQQINVTVDGDLVSQIRLASYYHVYPQYNEVYLERLTSDPNCSLCMNLSTGEVDCFDANCHDYP